MANDIIGSFLFLSLLSIFGTVIHTKEKLRVKTVAGKIDVLQLLYLVLIPLLLVVATFFIFGSIMKNPFVSNVRFDDSTAFFLLLFFSTFAGLGNGIHTASKTVSNFLRRVDNPTAYEVNEFFHIPLSHFILYISFIGASITLMLLEFNHPFQDPLSTGQLVVSALAGGLLGFSFGMIIYRTPIRNVFFPLSLIVLVGILSLVYSIQPDIERHPATIYFTFEILFLFLTSIWIYFKRRRSKRVFLLKF